MVYGYSDELPNGQFVPARFPYIVYDVIQPGLSSRAVSNVSIWDRDLTPTGAPGRPGFYGRVNNIAEQIIDKIDPMNGIIIYVREGQHLTLKRGSVPFQIGQTGETDLSSTIVRIFINLEIGGFVI